MAIILLIKTEDGQVTELPLLNRRVTLGRSSSCDFKISDIKMSGSHCAFEINPKGQILFADLSSTNGSFLNNSQISHTLVRINDIIKVGNTLIKIDEKRLSPSERIAIGTSQPKKSEDKTLPDLVQKNASSKNDNKPDEGEDESDVDSKSLNRKTVVLSNKIKERKKSPASWGSKENVIDQEPSSGMTKFLKLNAQKADKKKK